MFTETQNHNYDDMLSDVTSSMGYLTGVRFNAKELAQIQAAKSVSPALITNVVQASIDGMAFAPICPEHERIWNWLILGSGCAIAERSIYIRPCAILADCPNTSTKVVQASTSDLADNQPLPNPINHQQIHELIKHPIPAIYKPTEAADNDYSEPTGVTFIPNLGLCVISPIEFNRYYVSGKGDFYPELDIERFEEQPETRIPLLINPPAAYFSRLFRFWQPTYQGVTLTLLAELKRLANAEDQCRLSGYIEQLGKFEQQVKAGEFSHFTNYNRVK